MSEQKQIQEFCCWHWKQLIQGGDIITKSKAFNDGKNFKNDLNFYNIHPNFIKWIDDKNPMKSGWHWYHYCPNCGAQKDSNEVIKAWREYWNSEST